MDKISITKQIGKIKKIRKIVKINEIDKKLSYQ